MMRRLNSGLAFALTAAVLLGLIGLVAGGPTWPQRALTWLASLSG